MTKQVVLSEGY